MKFLEKSKTVDFITDILIFITFIFFTLVVFESLFFIIEKLK